jgi:hypothetical protein
MNKINRQPGYNTAAARLLTATALVLAFSQTAQAYVGPGAGFAGMGSFMAVFSAVLAGLLATFIPRSLNTGTIFSRKDAETAE